MCVWVCVCVWFNVAQCSVQKYYLKYCPLCLSLYAHVLVWTIATDGYFLFVVVFLFCFFGCLCLNAYFQRLFASCALWVILKFLSQRFLTAVLLSLIFHTLCLYMYVCMYTCIYVCMYVCNIKREGRLTIKKRKSLFYDTCTNLCSRCPSQEQQLLESLLEISDVVIPVT